MSTLPTERAIWVGNVFGTIAYGIYVYMVFHTWYLMKDLKTETPRMKAIYISFGFIQLLLLTLELATNAITEQFMWIDHRDFPGGPFAYFLAVSSSWYQTLNVSCGVLSVAMSDALLLYRCYLIWGANLRIVAFPILLLIGEVVMGIFVPVETAVPNANFFSKQSTTFSIPWVSLACSLNTILTLLIIGRILYVGHQAKTQSSYTGVVAILIESAIPLALSGLAFVICIGTNVIESVPFGNIWGTLVAISPQAIILRVAMGRAWTEQTKNQLTTSLHFAERKTSDTDDAFYMHDDGTPQSRTMV